MGKPDEMIKQIHEKVEAGFTTLKMKVGAIDFEKSWKSSVIFAPPFLHDNSPYASMQTGPSTLARHSTN